MKEKVDQIIADILNHLKSTDGTIETAIEIVDVNQKLFAQLQEIRMHIGEEVLITLQEIYSKQKDLVYFIYKEKDSMEKRFFQISKKEKILSSYITQNVGSIFVDKDFN
ncbi:MAG: hypothetical protein ACOWWR_04010 [Eubacteriales bacterium]